MSNQSIYVKKPYSVVFRILHWSIAITFFLLLGTLITRLYLLNKYDVAAIIQSRLAGFGASISQEDAIKLAKVIRNRIWDWHMIFGYILIGLFAIRFALPAFGEMKFRNPFKKTLTRKQKCQYWIYLIFYVCVVISLITGIITEWVPKTYDFRSTAKAIHKLSIYYLMAYIAIHLLSVFWAEFTDQKGIISKVISGEKKD